MSAVSASKVASTTGWGSFRRITSDHVQYGLGATIARCTSPGGNGVVCPFGELTIGRPRVLTW